MRWPCTPCSQWNPDQGCKNRGRTAGDKRGLDGLRQRQTVNHESAMNPLHHSTVDPHPQTRATLGVFMDDRPYFITVEEAQSISNQTPPTLRIEHLPIEACSGRALAEDLGEQGQRSTV